MPYSISQVWPGDTRGLAQVDALLLQEGISRDKNLDYICAMYDEDYQIIATGSCFGNTLRCFAVSYEHQGEGLLNQIVTHLMDIQYQRGNLHLFLYTKVDSAKFFGSLGFYEIARVDGTLVFMENRRDGFSRYLRELKRTHKEGCSAALVMNANPFTYGHQYLAEVAARDCDILHLFVVSEDASLIPFSVRKRFGEGWHCSFVQCYTSAGVFSGNLCDSVYAGGIFLEQTIFSRLLTCAQESRFRFSRSSAD